MRKTERLFRIPLPRGITRVRAPPGPGQWLSLVQKWGQEGGPWLQSHTDLRGADLICVLGSRSTSSEPQRYKGASTPEPSGRLGTDLRVSFGIFFSFHLFECHCSLVLGVRARQLEQLSGGYTVPPATVTAFQLGTQATCDSGHGVSSPYLNFLIPQVRTAITRYLMA